MRVSQKSIHLAIHGVLHAMGIKVGQSVSLMLVRRRWPETRLRDEDLDKGLKALQATGSVQLERTMFDDEVKLLRDDFGKVVTDEDRRALAALAVLRRVRVPAKVTGNLKPTRGRRPGDRDGRP